MKTARAIAVLFATAGLSLSGCGGDEKSAEKTTLKGENDPAATEAGQDYVDGYYDQDAEAVCRILAASVREQLDAQEGCVKTVEESFPTSFRQKLRAKRSYVNGDKAIVIFDKSPRQVTVQREGGGWKVINGGA
jgi:hypothetical protein